MIAWANLFGQVVDWNAVADFLSAVSITVAALVAAWGINAWRREFIGKRRIELAEDVLSAFFAVRDAISSIRNPWSAVNEGLTREKRDNETPEETDLLNRAYVVTERYLKREEVFSRFRTLKYRFMATFGKETETNFSTVDRVLNRIFSASRDAHTLEAQLQSVAGLQERKKALDEISDLKPVFYDHGLKCDEINQELGNVLSELERVTKRCFGRYCGNT